jgi:hypothetical protein
MHISHAAFLVTMLCAPSVGLAGQSAPAANSASQAAPAPAQSVNRGPSGLLQPSLDALEQAVGAVKLEKWKGGTARAEAGPNISSILRDLQTTLPALLKEADAVPGSVSKSLPVSTNVDALYDVVLRVVDGAKVSAPGDQFAQLQQAMAGLEKARHALDDSMLEAATAGEKHLIEVQGSLVKAQAAAVCPVAPPPAAAAPEPAPKKKVVKKKPKPPATTTPAPAAQPSGTAKPNP